MNISYYIDENIEESIVDEITRILDANNRRTNELESDLIFTMDFNLHYEKLISQKTYCIICSGASVSFELLAELRNRNISFVTKLFEQFFDGNNSYLLVELSNLVSKNALFQKFSKIVSLSFKEMERLKQIHSKLVPIRSQKFKGLEVASKYCAGTHNGSEFFELIKYEKELLIISLSSNSYLTSIALMNQLEVLKRKDSCCISTIKTFAQDFYHSSAEMLSNQENKIDLLIFRVDIKKMRIEGLLFGKYFLFNPDASILNKDVEFKPDNIDKAHFEISLQRGQKLLAFSPGVLLNLNGAIKGQSLESFVVSNKTQEVTALINDIFYEMGKDHADGLLNYDASIFSLKVAENVFIEV